MPRPSSSSISPVCRLVALALAIAAASFLASGCGCESAPEGVRCDEQTPCPPGQVCSPDHICVPAGGDGGIRDRPRYEGQKPVPDASPYGPCSNDDDCENDSYCDKGQCVPYGPSHDRNTQCQRAFAIGVLSPTVRCEWLRPEEDNFPDHKSVLSTPMVVDFHFGSPTEKRPSMVFVTYNGEDGDMPSCSGHQNSGEIDPDHYGIIRIVDGATCKTQYTLPGHVIPSAPPAVGDIDRDGRPEVVAMAVGGGAIAYRYDAAQGTFVQLWRTQWTRDDGQCYWSGPSLHDLNNDGSPEVVIGPAVFDASGNLLDDSLFDDLVPASLAPDYDTTGLQPVVADVDGDGQPEMSDGRSLWRFDAASHGWQLVRAGLGRRGQIAVADFGTFGDDPSKDDRAKLDGIAEIVVIGGRESETAQANARVMTLAGRVIYGPVPFKATYGHGSGGPPTVADFDGDGRAELAAAGEDAFFVFDPDCKAPADEKTCASKRTDGILWTRPSQDSSSNSTGSSVFDFEGDGKAEVIYADECYARVYDGQTGSVLWSQYHTSCTWQENPIVADVNGTGRSKLLIPSNSGLTCYEGHAISCPDVDPIFDGLRCDTDADCPTVSSKCVKEQDSNKLGLCRCAGDADCGGNGAVCHDPEAGPSAKGKTCRAGHAPGAQPQRGVRVIADRMDRWVSSRQIWNQHAYAVTNINEDGTLPRTADWKANWKQPKLNNFRQNVQGEAPGEDKTPDMTSRAIGFSCNSGTQTVTLKVTVCNRGMAAVAAGIPVTFYDATESHSDPTKWKKICTAQTKGGLAPGSCEENIGCDWPNGPWSNPKDVVAVADDDGTGRGTVAECLEHNNRARYYGLTCGEPVP